MYGVDCEAEAKYDEALSSDEKKSVAREARNEHG